MVMLLAWILPLLFGVAVGVLLRGQRVWYVAGGVPLLWVAGIILYQEYMLPYVGGGASMWPVALLFAGSTAALCGIAGALLGRWLRQTGRR